MTEQGGEVLPEPAETRVLYLGLRTRRPRIPGGLKGRQEPSPG